MKKVNIKVSGANEIGFAIFINLTGNGHSSSVKFDQDTPVIPGFSLSTSTYSIAIHVVTDGYLTISFKGINNITPNLPTFSNSKSDYLGSGTV